MKEKILSIVRELQDEREKAHVKPVHVLTAEIANKAGGDPRPFLNELVQEGRVSWCRTINDVAFTISKENTNT